jgi:phosphatidylinositol dimannoside acyltransferase
VGAGCRMLEHDMSELLLRVLERLLDLASALIRACPGPVRYAPADLITAVLALAWPRLRAQALENFAIAFDTGPRERRPRALARASVRSFGRMATDFLWLRTLAQEEIPRVAEAAGVEHLAGALRAGRGVILVLPHLGCWDVAAALASAAGLPITIVTEDGWGARLVAGSRRRPGVRLAPRERSLRPLLRALGRNEAVALLADLARSGVHTLEVPFFGRPAPMPSGPARLSVRTGAPILVVCAVRSAPGRYRVELQPPLRTGADSDEESAVRQLTAGMAAGFERAIRAYPDQWYPFSPIWPATGSPPRARPAPGNPRRGPDRSRAGPAPGPSVLGARSSRRPAAAGASAPTRRR